MIRWGRVALVTLLTATAAACGASSKSAQPTAQLIVAATSSVDSTKFDTVLSFGPPGDTIRIESTGAVDFANHGGEYTVREADSQGSSSDDAKSATEEVRWIGLDAYSHQPSSLTGTRGGGWVYVNGAKVHAAAPCLGKTDVVTMIGGTSVVSPSEILDTLREKGKGLERVGSDMIRGVSTTHWRVAPTEWPVHSGCSYGSGRASHTTVKGGIDVWTDSKDRARRLDLAQTQTSELDGDSTTTKSDTTTDFFDFGTPVDVPRPAAQEVVDNTAGLIALLLGPGTAKASDWRDTTHGSSAGKPGHIFYAATTTGWKCYDATGASAESPVTLGEGLPEHDGRPSTCLVPNGYVGFFGPADVFVNSSGAAGRTLIGAIAADGAARLVFADGTSQPLPVDPNSKIFDWSGPSAPRAVRIEVGDQSCQLFGTPGSSAELSTNTDCMGIAPG